MRQMLPDLNARVSVAEASRIKREVMISTLNQKADWLDRNLKKLLPPHIYNMAFDNTGTDDEYFARQYKVAKYMKDQDIRTLEQGLNCALYKGKTRISLFGVRQSEK